MTSVGAAGAITGSTAVNAGASGVAYSISAVSGASSYNWTLPTGATIASGSGSASITVNYSCSASSGNVQVTPVNGSCSGTASAALVVTVTPVGAAGAITGSSTVCSGQSGVTYSISSVSGASTYNWTVPTGASITAGAGTTSITVTFGSSSGNVQVTPANANGCNGTAKSLAITVNSIPATPGTITQANPSGSSVISGLSGVTYTITAVSGAATYTWTVPSGASITSGQGTTSIVVNWGTATSGNVTVTAGDTCGTSSASTLAVTVGTATTSVTTSPSAQAACSGSTATFTVTASGTSTVNYQWEKVGGGWGSGNGWTLTGTTYLGSSTDNEDGNPSCSGTSFNISGQHDINSSSGNALGMYGTATALRSFPGLTTFPVVVSVDMDNGSVDNGDQSGFVLQTSAAASVLKFYFQGGGTDYLYAVNGGTPLDTGIAFTRTGLRIQWILNSSTSYTLIVIPCGGTPVEFTGTYSGTIAALKLFDNNSGDSGSQFNLYFNNIIVGGYSDNADNYVTPGWSTGSNLGQGPISGATSSTYTTPTLTSANNNDQYQVVVYNNYGAAVSSAATLTVNSNPTITTTSPLTAGTQNVAYNQSVASSGGSGSGYTYSKTSGTLPTGITLSSGGTLTRHVDSAGHIQFHCSSAGQQLLHRIEGIYPRHCLQCDHYDHAHDADSNRGSIVQPTIVGWRWPVSVHLRYHQRFAPNRVVDDIGGANHGNASFRHQREFCCDGHRCQRLPWYPVIQCGARLPDNHAVAVQSSKRNGSDHAVP